MPIQYVWTCTATIKANTPPYTEIGATCVEDPARGAENAIQRVYPIRIISILVRTDVQADGDYVVRIKKAFNSLYWIQRSKSRYQSAARSPTFNSLYWIHQAQVGRRGRPPNGDLSILCIGFTGFSPRTVCRSTTSFQFFVLDS